MKTPGRIRIIDILKSKETGKEFTIKGWVRTKRTSRRVTFIELNDGSTINGLQLVIDVAIVGDEKLKQINTGACLKAEGLLVESPSSGQPVEMQVKNIEIYGRADAESYPLQKKEHTQEYLREIAHLRPRTKMFGAVLRMRHAMSYAIHKYFNDNGFFYLHTPIITASDAEGAGAMFQVTTLNLDELPKNKDSRTDYSNDFFGKRTSLTVSGQLEGELGALALGQIYTFGPTFRAENSNTPRHLAEFWMVEPEMAFYEIEDNMTLAEDFIKYLVKYALENCTDDLAFLNTKDSDLLARLKGIVETDFVRLEYTEAIQILEKADHVKFDYPIYWGVDLQAEHERYLVERHFGKPIIMTNYPKNIKAFYMKMNDDGKTVRAMDVLFPAIGEIIGGSQREENLDKLSTRIEELGISTKDLWWYLETRKFGSAPHSGFGLGFERLLLFLTGMPNIRDVIPFPRTPRNAEF